MKKAKTKKILSIKTKKGKLCKTNKNLITILDTHKSPIFKPKYMALVKPIFFAGSPVPRFRVIANLDPKEKDVKKYFDELEKIAKENKVDKICKQTEEGIYVALYQGRDKPDVFVVIDDEKIPVDLEHDLPKNISCQVVYELRKYKDTRENQFSFTYPPKEVIFYPSKKEIKDLEWK
jgi:hypothetical protein